jgi:hypothetical protein
VKAGFRRDVVYNHAWQGAVYGVQWPPGKLSQQCRKSSLCTVSYDTIPLEVRWRRGGIVVCVCVCVMANLYHSTFNFLSLLFLLLLHHFHLYTFLLSLTCICLACRYLTHYSYTYPFARLPLIRHPTYSFKPPKDPLPRLRSQYATQAELRTYKGRPSPSKLSTVRQSPDPYNHRRMRSGSGYE